jgi:class 3 adenylate cyclase
LLTLPDLEGRLKNGTTEHAMVSLDQTTEPTTSELLIAFADLRGFTRIAKDLKTPEAQFGFLDDLANVMAGVVGTTNGKILKFIGDACLVVYPGPAADAGVRNLLELKETTDSHIESQGLRSRLSVAAHYGEAMIGPFGPERQLDAIGEAVNRAALAERGDHRSEFVITPEAFRRLESETRKLFRKHTPPIVYLAR